MLVNKTITQAFGHIVMGLEDATRLYPFKFILNFFDLTYVAPSSFLFLYTKYILFGKNNDAYSACYFKLENPLYAVLNLCCCDYSE